MSGAIGLYRQPLAGISDTRDVGSVFIAWRWFPGASPGQTLHAQLGWQQTLGTGLHWGLEGYYRQLAEIPVPLWSTIAQFNTELAQADGRVYGADLRLEYERSSFYGYLGYGYSWTRYESAQDHFGIWYGEPVQTFHPPHDRRHQVNAVLSLDFGEYTTAARWQFGSGLPFTRPMGFDEIFDFRFRPNVSEYGGTTRLLMERPYLGRLPMIHRLDVSVERSFDVRFGTLQAQAGAVNLYDRTNMFFYDIYTHRRVDQLPLVPYLTLRLEAG